MAPAKHMGAAEKENRNRNCNSHHDFKKIELTTGTGKEAKFERRGDKQKGISLQVHRLQTS